MSLLVSVSLSWWIISLPPFTASATTPLEIKEPWLSQSLDANDAISEVGGKALEEAAKLSGTKM